MSKVYPKEILEQAVKIRSIANTLGDNARVEYNEAEKCFDVWYTTKPAPRQITLNTVLKNEPV